MKKKFYVSKEMIKTAIGIVVTFLIMLLYNCLSPYTADDYSYMYSAVTGEKVKNVFQIINSLQDDYMHVNGRVLPHFFLQIFLIGSKWIFNIVNAAMHVWLIWLIQRVAGNKDKINWLFWIATVVGLWVFLPAYGQVFLWMTGSINYAWSFVFALVYVNFYIRIYRDSKDVLRRKQLIGLCIYAFLFGAYSAQVSFATVFASFLMICIVMYEQHSVKKYWCYVIPIVTAALGYLTMVLSPAEGERLPEMSLGIILGRIIDLFEVYYSGTKALLGVWAVLMTIAICFNINKKEMIVSVAFVFISIVAMSMLFAASYVVGRHYANSVFFLIMAIAVLMQAICKNGKIGCAAYCICVYMIATNLWTIWDGSYDIYSTFKQQCEREAYIYEQKALGNEEIYVPIIRPLTKYSCKYDLIDLQKDDKQPWPNYAVAAYYGVDKIYGVE